MEDIAFPTTSPMHLKQLLLILVLCFPVLGFSQFPLPHTVSASYFGEFISHPGIRIGVQYDLATKTRMKTTSKRNSQLEFINQTQHALGFRPSLGFFYHRRHQTGLFVLPEIGYLRTNQKRKQFGAGIGFGYMHSIIPNVFRVTPEGEVESTSASHGSFLTSAYIRWGRQFKESPYGYFIQPQFIYALPNYPNGIAYLALEVGITYNLNFNSHE